MTYFFFGFLVGLIPLLFFIVGALWGFAHKEGIEREMKKVEENPLKIFKRKVGAEFVDPTSPEVDAMEVVIQGNEKKGRDTEMKDL